jgi:hypothetical protein
MVSSNSLGTSESIKVNRYSRKQVNFGFLSDEHGTKHALAEYFAGHFPKVLTFRLPPKCRSSMKKDRRMDIFYALEVAERFPEREGITQRTPSASRPSIRPPDSQFEMVT